MNNVLLIDTTGIIHRLWVMNGKMPSHDRELMDNVAQFIEMQRRVHRPTHTICTFDDCKSSWRQDLTDDYSYHGSSLPTSFIEFQLTVIENLKKQGIHEVVIKENTEGYDVLSHISLKLKSVKNTQIRVISSDKRYLSMVSPDFLVFMPLSRYPEDRKRTSEWIEIKFGLKPEQMTDYFMLVGDPSHNNKGVKGIGPKKAVSLLGEYSDFDKIIEESAAIEGSLGKTLRALSHEDITILKKVFMANEEIDLNLSLKQFRDFKYQPYIGHNSAKSM